MCLVRTFEYLRANFWYGVLHTSSLHCVFEISHFAQTVAQKSAHFFVFSENRYFLPTRLIQHIGPYFEKQIVWALSVSYYADFRTQGVTHLYLMNVMTSRKYFCKKRRIHVQISVDGSTFENTGAQILTEKYAKLITYLWQLVGGWSVLKSKVC